MALKQGFWSRIREALTRRKAMPGVVRQSAAPAVVVDISPKEIPTHAVVQVVEPVAPGDKRALVFLSSSEEGTILRRLLVGDGWTVGTYDSYETGPGTPPKPGLVVTDTLERLAQCETLFGNLPPAVLVADNDDSAVTAALDYGADWVLRRPLDPENPLIEWL